MRYVALLGGINVGGHRVKMTELRAVFEALGFQNVATFIASGNVLFDADSTDALGLAAQIEQRLAECLHVGADADSDPDVLLQPGLARHMNPDAPRREGIHEFTPRHAFHPRRQKRTPRR